jgi:HK97 family phage portal protein
MLKTLGHKLALIISPKAANPKIDKVRVESYQAPNIPIYTDMSVYKATREGYKISVFVYRAVRTIIQAASAVPWIVVDRDDEPIVEHPLELVLKRPNPEFSGQDLIELLIAHLELVGNALWQPIIVGNQIKEIWPVMPDLVRPIPSKERGEWLKGWDVTVDGRHEILPPNQFIHFLQVDPGNPYWGISPLMAAARTVDTDNEAQDTQKISMQNRGLVDGVFTHEAPLTQEQFEEARRQIREKFLDKSRRREPWVLGAGAKWNQMSLTPVEMDFIASRLANMRAIAAAFGLDPWWLGDKQASTFSNVAEARRALYEDVVIPLLDDVESTINLKISPMYGDIKVTYNLSGIPAMREDFGKKVTQAKDLWNMGVPFEQINTRLEMGFEEFRGWESGYLPMNLLPTGAPRPEEEPEAEEEETEGEGKKKFKSLNLESEEAKTVYWKMIDRRRLGWWGVISKKIEPLYKKEMEKVIKALSEVKQEDRPRGPDGRWLPGGGGEVGKPMTDEERWAAFISGKPKKPKPEPVSYDPTVGNDIVVDPSRAIPLSADKLDWGNRDMSGAPEISVSYDKEHPFIDSDGKVFTGGERLTSLETVRAAEIWGGDLSTEQSDSVLGWIDSPSDIVDYQRTGEGSAETVEAERGLMAALESAPIYVDTGYRGMTGMSDEDMAGLASSDVIEMRGLTSVSSNPKTALTFAHGKKTGSRVMMEMHTKTARYISNLSLTSETEESLSEVPYEHEALFMSGSRHSITGRSIVRIGGKDALYIRTEEI